MRALERCSLAVGRAAVSAYDRARRGGVRLPGVGRLLRLTRGEHVISYRGLAWALRGPDAAAYFMMLVGKSNEPETLAFLGGVLERSVSPVTFVDVGANLGEFLLDVGRHPGVREAIGFEPDERCASACRESIRLNGLEGRVRVVESAVGARPGRARLFRAGGNPLASSLVEERGDAVEVGVTTLDAQFPPGGAGRGALLLLLDVEGAELLVLQGGRALLAESLPLVVFEHNETSRRHYGLGQVRRALPPGYEILRLRGDGRIDRDLSRTWNCVALHPDSPLAGAVAPLVAGEPA